MDALLLQYFDNPQNKNNIIKLVITPHINISNNILTNMLPYNNIDDIITKLKDKFKKNELYAKTFILDYYYSQIRVLKKQIT